MRWLRRLLCALLMVVLAGVPAALPAQAEGEPEAAQTTRILLYGDSLTQATAAQWTWRYRVWQRLQAGGTPVDFVGPHDTLLTYPASTPTSYSYRAAFDRDHAALGGNTLTESFERVSTLADTHAADVVVSLIGVNDLRRKLATPAELVDRLREEIEAARALRPGVAFVLVQLGQTWIDGVTAYDEGLVALAAELDRPDARVVATVRPAMTPSPDTFDWLHLTASGELKVATAVTEALGRVGLASATPPPDPPDDGSWAPTPYAAVSGSWVAVWWGKVDYASTVNIHVRDRTTGAVGVVKDVRGTWIWLPGQRGHTYEISLAPAQAWAEIGTRSRVIVVSV